VSRIATATNARTQPGVAAFVCTDLQARLRVGGLMADGISGLMGPGEAGVPPH
jgi:hypothetical protein